MSITHINRKQKIYYLHQGKTNKGNPKYFFSIKTEGDLAKAIPDGYEIYETPNGQVFLRKIQPKLITDEELAVVETGMNKFAKIKPFIIDVKKEIISIFTPHQDVSGLTELLQSTASSFGRDQRDIQELLTRSLSYSADLRFILVDPEKRLFQTERYCYLGSIDDWIEIGAMDKLERLVKKYVKHIGQESFYDLQ